MSSEIPTPETTPLRQRHPEFFDTERIIEPFVDNTQMTIVEKIDRIRKQHPVLQAIAATAFMGAVLAGSLESMAIAGNLNAKHNAPAAEASPTPRLHAQPNKTPTTIASATGKPKTTATKPTTVTTLPATEIAKPLLNSDPLFASKPSWVQDYAAMPDGPVSGSMWNFATGNGVDGWGNNEAEYYTDNPANLRVENGALIIEARHQEYKGYDYTSARIDTDGKESFEYGELSIVAEVPGSAQGDWFAAWMLAENNKYENLSPLSDTRRWKNDGEIDLMEGIGSNPTYEYATLHALQLNGQGHAVLKDESTSYNNYTMKWTPNSITFLVNNKAIYEAIKKPGETYKQYPFNQAYYLVLNVAMGGTWGSGDAADKAKYGKNGINNAALPAKLKIQSIAYYPYVGAKK